MFQLYTQIPPQALLSQIINLKDHSLIYLSQLLAAQYIVDLLDHGEYDLIQAHNDQYRNFQETISR